MFEKLSPPAELRPSDPRFGAGPSLVPKVFLERLAQTGAALMGTSHRQNAVKSVVGELRAGLKTYFNLPNDYEVVLGNGGATLLFDMIGLGMVEKSSFHYTMGEFSQKWFKAHRAIPGLEVNESAADFGKGEIPCHQAGYDFLCATLNETSTGVITPALPEKKNDVIVSIDGTSGAGQIDVDFNRCDMLFFSPQKVFASDGGLWVALMNEAARERALKLAKNPPRYIPEIMNWSLAIDNSLKDQTYNTPAIATLFLLNEQVKEMNKIGYEKVKKMAGEKADLVYRWAEEKPYLNPFVADPQYRSSTVATIDIDEKIPVDDLLKSFRRLGWVYDIDGYRKLGRNQVRIGLFHNVKKEDVEKLTQLISFAIEEVL